MRLQADLVYEAVNEETRSQLESVAHLRSTLQMVHETVLLNMGCKQKHQKNTMTAERMAFVILKETVSGW